MSTATDSIRGSRNALELELKRAGATLKGKVCKCPFHEDKNASAGIYEKDGVWRFKCQVPTCGICGDVFDIRAMLEKRPVEDLLREATYPGGEQPAEKRAAPKRVFRTVADIVSSVGNLGTVEAHYEYTNPTTGEIEIVQIRYREGEKKKFLVHHGADGGFVLGAPPKPWPIYNRKRIQDAARVVVVEGEKCVHALHAIGVVATTSLSGAGNGDKADWTPLAGKKVYIWPDNDPAGTIYAEAVVAKLEAVRPQCEVYVLDPSGLGLGVGGDVADFIAEGATAEEVWCVLTDGSELAGSQNDLLGRINDIIAGKWSSLEWPWKKLTDAAKALFPGTITVLCGDPASSKSFMILQAAHWWHKCGEKIALLELEDDRPFHMLRLLAVLSGRWDVLNDKWGRENADEFRSIYEQHRPDLEAFAGMMHAAPMGQFSYPHALEWIETQCAAGAKILCIDPITAVCTGDNRHIEDLSFIVKAALILKKHSARLVLITHPRVGSVKRGAASQDDMAGGRAFSRHTQTVLWLHRHDPPKQFQCVNVVGQSTTACNRSLHICKARNGPGHGWKIGFTLDRNVQFTEHGVVTAEHQTTEVTQLPSF